MRSLLLLIYYDIRANLRQAFAWLAPLLFFMMVVCLFPLALGPDTQLLAHIAPGIIWVTALLAVMSSVGQLFSREADEGILDLWLLSPQGLVGLVLSKAISHWLMHSLPLIVITPFLALLLGISWQEQVILEMTLLLGTPVFSLVGAMGAALVVGLRGHGLLLPVLTMPLYVPVLIFGAGTVLASGNGQPITSGMALLGALLLLTLAVAPILTSVALRIGVNQ